MTRLLVTGGLGFIGSNLIRYLVHNFSEEYEISNIDKLGIGSNRSNLDGIDLAETGYQFLENDINDISTIKGLIKPDIILNLAAESHVDRSIKDPSPFIRSNYSGTFELLEYLRRNDVRKFVQISTDEVYGQCPPGHSFTEDDLLNPGNPYSATKAAADLLVSSYCKTYGINASITRCTNNFGPYQHVEKLIPRTIARILKRVPIMLYGDGLQIRDWLYVDNHAIAIYDVMTRGKANEVYNISTSNLVSNIELVERINQITNELVGVASPIKLTNDRPGHDKRYSLNAEKIKRDLHWKPLVAFEEGLRSTVKWYISHENWWTGSVDRFILQSW